MRALVWIVEDTWQATVEEAAAFLPAGAEVTLLHVASTEPEGVARAARQGLLGRRPAPPPEPREQLRAISEEAARSLLEEARRVLGRDAQLEALRADRVGHAVAAVAEGMDILVLARDGDHSRLGPPSLGRHARFVVDHAPCRVLLIWPDEPPAVDTIPPPPPHGTPPPPPPPR